MILLLVACSSEEQKDSAVFQQDLEVELQCLEGEGSGLPIAPSRYNFTRADNNDRGAGGSELLPHTAKVVKELCIVYSTFTEAINHDPAATMFQTGSVIAGRPSMGAWSHYGLGSDNRNLPGFVVLNHGVVPCGGLENYSNGFLPARHQATMFAVDGPPVRNLLPADKNEQVQLSKLALLKGRDRAFSQSLGGDDAIDSAIRNYELAFRMQSMIPEILDLSEETRATQAAYAVDSKVKSQSLFGIQCLRARRLVESGVRFVEITCAPGNANGTWDQHSNLKKGHEKNSLDTDQSITALIKDLKARGMLDETPVSYTHLRAHEPLR
mgnify:CR=1 FL=1